MAQGRARRTWELQKEGASPRRVTRAGGIPGDEILARVLTPGPPVLLLESVWHIQMEETRGDLEWPKWSWEIYSTCSWSQIEPSFQEFSKTKAI